MKITFLLLPLFIALCAAVSKNHLKLRRSELQTTDSEVKYRTRGHLDVIIRVLVTSEANQRITIDNGQTEPYIFEGAADGAELGAEFVRVPEKGYNWTIKMEYQDDNEEWHPSTITFPSKNPQSRAKASVWEAFGSNYGTKTDVTVSFSSEERTEY